MTTDEFFRVVTQLQAARGYRDVFPDSDASKIKSTYRSLARHIHPDVVEASLRDTAAKLFAMLTVFYDQARQPTPGSVGSSRSTPPTFATANARHTLDYMLADWCDMTTCHQARTVTAAGTTYVSFIKLARQQNDNDLLALEASALERLWSGDPKRAMFFPKLIESFGVRTPMQRVRANALEWLEGFVNLEQVRIAYPNGVDPLDMAWMWRRVLWALDYAHSKQLVHGALLPQNILIHPAHHGLVLADWCYSSTLRATAYQPLTAIVARQRDWYPREVLAKQSVLPSLDIVMAARSMVYLMNGNPVTGTLPATIPATMRDYFATVVHYNAPLVKDAATAAILFDELLARLGRPFHPRAFRPFSV